MKAITSGTVVRPNHFGEDTRTGDTINYPAFRGRVVDTWMSPGTAGEAVARVVWFGAAKRVFGAFSNGYPLSMLDPA